MIDHAVKLLRDARLSRLVSKSQRGDREAFRELYRELYGPVMRFVRRRVDSAADAEDVVSQVFFQLLEALPKIDPQRRTVFAYVLASARNAVLERGRRPGPTADLEKEAGHLPSARPDALALMLSAETGAEVRAQLSALSPEVQEVLAMRFADELRYSEIAEIVGASEATVRQRVSRAVRDLRQRFGVHAEKGVVPSDA